ncbi:MAG: 4Fe-4S dicluster domain-containing protein, partial [Deltaproteobacteria bacterium]|nr:4Fe-4S dicluster domain-containing protein [Deltaproteobacteria bacterium]
MSDRYTITDSGVATLLDAIAKSGSRILGPKEVAERIEIAEIKNAGELAETGQSTVSAKATVFPKVERLLKYRFEGKNVTLEDNEPQAAPTVLFGIRPCEARAFHALDVVFNWDYKDKFFNERMANTTVVAMSCTSTDESCFCTSVGSRPDDTAGSDILLSPLKAGGLLAQVLTDKGKALVDLAKAAFQPLAGAPDLVPAATVRPAFDAKALEKKLGGKFDSPIWVEQSLRCLGCGACAYVCPTCVCFDIQDEADTRKGDRLRTWDSCGMRLFTLHASGHNPRDKQ